MKARLTPEAEQDADEAIMWYDEKSTALRRALLEVFPYQVLYEIDPTEIVVYAIYHCARDPGGWKKRPPA